MTQQSSNITKLEWVSCPFCSTTFQVAIPAKATDMRVWTDKPWSSGFEYCLPARCINSTCGKSFWVQTNLPLNI